MHKRAELNTGILQQRGGTLTQKLAARSTTPANTLVYWLEDPRTLVLQVRHGAAGQSASLGLGALRPEDLEVRTEHRTGLCDP